MHCFQLWINLPAAHKFDDPSFQHAENSSLPIVSLDGGRTQVKVLVGSKNGKASPVQSRYVPVEYMDFMASSGSEFSHTPPIEQINRMAYIYSGHGNFGGQDCKEGDFVILSGEAGTSLQIKASIDGLGFLFISGKPIGDPIVQHGPFVMNTSAQIQQCFSDYQTGEMFTKIPTHLTYSEQKV